MPLFPARRRGRELPLFPALFPDPEPALSAALVRAAASAVPSVSATRAACKAWDAAAAAGALDSKAKRRKLCAEHGIHDTPPADDTPAACLARARKALAARVISGTKSLRDYWQSAAADCRSTTAPVSAEAGSVCRALAATDVTAEGAAPDGPLLPGVVLGCAAAATSDLNADVAALPDVLSELAVPRTADHAAIAAEIRVAADVILTTCSGAAFASALDAGAPSSCIHGGRGRRGGRAAATTVAAFGSAGNHCDGDVNHAGAALAASIHADLIAAVGGFAAAAATPKLSATQSIASKALTCDSNRPSRGRPWPWRRRTRARRASG